MKLIQVAAAVLNQTPLDWNGNKRRILEAIGEARRLGVRVLCLPELCVTGYGCEDAFHSPGLQAMAQRVLLEIVPETKGLIVSLGLPLLYHHGLFNTACLVVDGRILGLHRQAIPGGRRNRRRTCAGSSPGRPATWARSPSAADLSAGRYSL